MLSKKFEKYLRGKNLAENSIKSYLWTVDFFKEHYARFNKRELMNYREYLIENFKPQTVNLRINAINKYLNFIGKQDLYVPYIKAQKRNYVDDVISVEEYSLLKCSLKNEGKKKWYFIVWLLGATGVRVSELVRLRIEDIRSGYADLCSKGEKIRRIYVPSELQKECLEWLNSEGRCKGFLFLNRFDSVISPRGISGELKRFAKQYGICDRVVHPHSFRHYFAKCFLENSGDITFLADLLGHESIETTRIYLRKTSMEQRNFIDSVVTW